jgi:integration host factor subunit beta
MLKRDIVDAVAQEMRGYMKKDIARCVDIILEEITQSLSREQRVEIRGFGCFSVRERKAKSTKNPKSGKLMDIPARKTLHFAMSKSLKTPLIKGEEKA